MAPRSANRNPETKKPARALPPPDTRVSSVLPAKSTDFDCIIPGGPVGQAITSGGLLGWAFGPRNPMKKGGACFSLPARRRDGHASPPGGFRGGQPPGGTDVP